jgi:hypothetical protein
LASWRLPEDPAVTALEGPTRERLGRHCAARASSELRVSCVFAVVARGLMETGAEPEVLRIVAGAVGDEVHHADVCRQVAERYLGRTVPWPAPGRARMPSLAGAPRRLRPTLHAVAMGCMSETIAASWLDVSLRGAASLTARAAVRELLTDDIHHARFGWAHLASSYVGAEGRDEVGRWLPLLLEAAVLPWMDAGRETMAEGMPAHGVPSRETTLAVVRGTVEEVILPGFEGLGVPTRGARIWCERHIAE